MSQQVYSVRQVNEYICAILDQNPNLTSIAVRGEISNYKVYPSGHHYFSLKDESGALRCVMFKGNAIRMRFRPENGMKVIALGKISVYPRDGIYQLYCTAMTPDGVGDLYAAFEQLKKRLGAQGLFDAAHKKPLPRFPDVIGIVTSPAGAAVHDMLRILRRRYPLTQVRLLPVRVQGAEAPAEIASAIRYANHYRLADLLIVGRGGGSMEDLWAFNDEQVAHAIYDSVIPVISAVGHEPDVTISDYVADLRAATPSNAAELAVPDQNALRQTLDGMYGSMQTILSRQLAASRRQLDALAASPALQSPESYLRERGKSLLLLKNRLISSYTHGNEKRRQRFIGLTSKLDGMSPLKVLTRGYAMVEQPGGELLRSVHQTAEGERVTVLLQDGRLDALVTEVKENLHESEQPHF